MSKPQYPRVERVWVEARKDGKIKYIITSKINSREFYYLYEYLPTGEFRKFGRSRSPKDLEDKFDEYKSKQGE